MVQRLTYRRRHAYNTKSNSVKPYVELQLEDPPCGFVLALAKPFILAHNSLNIG
jgi:hypothetical protein